MTNILLRRAFLKNACAIWLATLTKNSVFAQKQKNEISVLPNINFLEKLTKQTYSLKELSAHHFSNSYTIALNHWEKSGYYSLNTNFYICQQERLAIFPLIHSSPLSKPLDNAILCFGKNQQGEWIELKSLSGFELEALAVAAEGLQKYNANIDLGDYLLPSPSLFKVINPFYYNTPKGSVFIKTFLKESNAETEIIVKESEKVLWQQTIISDYNLMDTVS